MNPEQNNNNPQGIDFEPINVPQNNDNSTIEPQGQVLPIIEPILPISEIETTQESESIASSIESIVPNQQEVQIQSIPQVTIEPVVQPIIEQSVHKLRQ